MFPLTTKFLIVDDFATMRKIVKKSLVDLGYSNIEEADDGHTALATLREMALHKTPIEVIFSDHSMPTMSGLDLLKACRADTRLAQTPFILVTAESEQRQIIEAAKAGVSEYVVKPFNAITLREKLEKVYHQQQKKKTA